MLRRCVTLVLSAALMLGACARHPPQAPRMAPAPLPPQVLQYPGEPPALRRPAPPAAALPAPAAGGPYVQEPPYTLDSGDRLRIVVFGQEGLSNVYAVDAAGTVSMPLIGSVPARGLTAQELAREIAARLRRGFVRDPSVSAEIVAYRPFFILGEVNNPGQYPYVANMTVENAVAIAGGFAPRADKTRVLISRPLPGTIVRFEVPLAFPLRPGDTVRVKERWF